MTAEEKLLRKIEQHKHICVGLDTDISKIPDHLKRDENGVFNFNKEIIEQTVSEVCAYKINLAFYEKDGKKGFEELEKTLEVIPDDIFVIGDAKRGDIGNTSQMYAESLYGHFKFDSVTLNPYMGYDSLQPFLNYSEKINFILALTSNPGSNDFEKQRLAGGEYLYNLVIKKAQEWNSKKNVGIVFGATNPTELETTINSFGNLWVLLPGIGAQGGNLERIVSVFCRAKNSNFIINISRAIIFAENSRNFASAATEKLADFNTQILDSLNI
ncbi:MAG: orotidine-5'-phosphate decarboxylase [Melioribacteraceae bacterium]|nr:orotidine-5'-phosphate decarboxylase [Melioribacteraceae bacterium]